MQRKHRRTPRESAARRVGERWLRTLRTVSWHVRGWLQDEVTIDTVHGRMTVSTTDRGVGRSLYLKRRLSFSTLQKTKRLLTQEGWVPSPDGYVIDVGANIGTACIQFVREGTFGYALAFEPEAANFRLLQRNIATNGLTERISALQIALTSLDGDLLLGRNPDKSGSHMILSSRARDHGWDRVAVPGRRLDRMLSDLRISPELVDLLWMDVQGYEGQVLMGSSSLLAAGVPVVAEFWPRELRRAGTDGDTLFDLLTGHGYDALYDLADPKVRRPIQSVREIFTHYETGPRRCGDLLFLKT